MSAEGCALQLLRACGVSTNQMMQPLQPFNTNLPANEQQLNAPFASMRRMGHITENTPGNIGAALHGSRGGGSPHLLTESYNTSTVNHSGASVGNTTQGSDQQNHLLGQTGHEEIDMSDLNGLNQSEASAHAYRQYRLHKRKWRRLSSKPTRKFRRIHKRFRTAKGKGKVF